MTTWVERSAGSLFDVDNLPYGVFSRAGEEPRVGVRIGDLVLDLAPVAAAEMLDVHHVFEERSLNALMAEGRRVRESVRTWITGLLTDPDRARPGRAEPGAARRDHAAPADRGRRLRRLLRLRAPRHQRRPDLPPRRRGAAAELEAPAGRLPRPRRHRRPLGHRRSCGRPGSAEATRAPAFGPSTRLDIEAELGFVVGSPSELGTPVSYGAFADHVFGVVGLNDWSARDIQAWEYVPLGPFLGKSFATSISQWVTPIEALDAAWVDLPGQDPEPLPYLGPGATKGLDIDVEVVVNGDVVSRPPYRTMYWSPAQMLAHLTVNGASLRTGDLYGSGTISGPEPSQRGSLLEIGWGDESAFLADGDEVTLRYTAPGTAGGRIALGEVTGVVSPARG